MCNFVPSDIYTLALLEPSVIFIIDVSVKTHSSRNKNKNKNK